MYPIFKIIVRDIIIYKLWFYEFICISHWFSFFIIIHSCFFYFICEINISQIIKKIILRIKFMIMEFMYFWYFSLISNFITLYLSFAFCFCCFNFRSILWFLSITSKVYLFYTDLLSVNNNSFFVEILLNFIFHFLLIIIRFI